MKTPQDLKIRLVALPRRCTSHWPAPVTRTKAGTPAGAAVWALLLALTTTAFGQSVDTIADREVQRRQAGMSQGEAAIARGQSALKARNYTTAYQEFKIALGYLPDSVVSGKGHDDAAEGICKSGTVLAEARIAQGDYPG